MFSYVINVQLIILVERSRTRFTSIVIITEYSIQCLAKLHELYSTRYFVILAFRVLLLYCCLFIHRFAVYKVVHH